GGRPPGVLPAPVHQPRPLSVPGPPRRPLTPRLDPRHAFHVHPDHHPHGIAPLSSTVTGLHATGVTLIPPDCQCRSMVPEHVHVWSLLSWPGPPRRQRARHTARIGYRPCTGRCVKLIGAGRP